MSDTILLVARAADFAARRHAGQKRKGAGGAPYVNHLTEVAATGDGGDSEIVAAAYLHDVVEDGHATLAEVAEHFNRRVYRLVEELTDDMSLPKEERKRRQVAEIAGRSAAARLIKLADKVSNLSEVAVDTPADWSTQDVRAYADWSVAVVDAGCRGLDAGLEQLFDEAAAKMRRTG